MTDDRAERTRNGLRRAPHAGTPAEHHVDLERERLGSPWRAGAARPHPHTSDTTIIIYSYGHGQAAPQPRLRAYRAPLLDVAPGFIPMLLHQATV